MKKHILFLLLLSWGLSAASMIQTWLDEHTNTIVSICPELEEQAQVIHPKVTAMAVEKNREDDYEYVKLLFLHYLTLIQINPNLLEDDGD